MEAFIAYLIHKNELPVWNTVRETEDDAWRALTWFQRETKEEFIAMGHKCIRVMIVPPAPDTAKPDGEGL